MLPADSNFGKEGELRFSVVDEFARLRRSRRAQRKAPIVVASETLEPLSDHIKRVQELLSDLRSLSAIFSNDLASCRNRRYSRDLWYLREYIDSVLSPVSREDEKTWCEILHYATHFSIYGTCLYPPINGQCLDQETQAYFYWFYLRELKSCEASLEAEIERILSQRDELISIGDTLDEEEIQKQEERRQRRSLWNRSAWSVRDMMVRAQLDLQFLLVSCKSSKYPDGDEPLCMTMPWNILPALVVLWGVCWMFYYSHGYSGSPLAQTPDILGHNDLYAPDWSQLLDLDYSDLTGLEPLTMDDGVNTGNPMPPAASSTPTGFLALPEYLHVDSHRSAHTDIPYSQGTGSELRFADEQFCVVEGEVVPAVSLTNDHQPLLRNNMTEIDHCNQSLESAATPDNSSAPATQPMPLSTHPSTCTYIECSELKFNDALELKKHDTRVHNRHECRIPGCDQSFGAKGDLCRHLRTKHNQLPLQKRLRCPETGCRYSRIPHFKRKDHLINHLKSMHNCDAADARARANGQANVSLTASQGVQEEPHPTFAFSLQPRDPVTHEFDATVFGQVRQEVSSDRSHVSATGSTPRRRAVKRNLRALDSCAPDPIEPIPETLAMWRSKAIEYKAQAEEGQSQYEALRRENESLKGELERLRKCEESLIAAVNALANR